MKKSIIFFAMLLICVVGLAQSKSDLAGNWKIFVKAGMKKTTPGYAVLKDDGSMIWGIDSTKSDPMDGSTTGNWDLTSENEIKITFSDTPPTVKYYVPNGKDMLYQFRYIEKDGVKVKDHSTDMDQYMQKLSN